MSVTTGRDIGALIYKPDGTPTWRYRVEPFQEAFRASGMTQYELAAAAGFTDPTYPNRLLGLRPWPGSRNPRTGKRYRTQCATTLSYDNAARLARALGVDLVEWEI